MRCPRAILTTLAAMLGCAAMPGPYASSASTDALQALVISSVDSFRTSFVAGDLAKSHFWIDASYRAICDSDTYYAYKSMESYVRIADGSLIGLSDDIMSVIYYYEDRRDTFGVKILSTAYSALGNFMLVTDYQRALGYYETAQELSRSIGDIGFEGYNIMLESEAYQRDTRYVEAAQLSRRLLNTKVAREYPVLRFMAETQLYKIYTQMRANSMVEHYGSMIESEGFYKTSLAFEARYLLRKVDHLISIAKYEEAYQNSLRLQQISALIATNMEVWRVNLQAAKILAALGRYDESLDYVAKCKSADAYIHGFRYTSQYSSYHVDLVEAWVAVERKEYAKARAILARSNPPQQMLDLYEYGISYFGCMEIIYSRSGDYRSAIKMVDAANRLRDETYNKHSIQRAQDLEYIYQSDTTIIGQDVRLNQKVRAVSSLQRRIVFWVLFIIIIVMVAGLVRTFVMRYRRKEKARMDIEHRKNLESEIGRQTHELRRQKNEISQKNQDIIMSQSYAKVIQQGILPSPEGLNYEELGGSFVVYRPLDVVSGDFYWFRRYGNNIVVCCADCSGHGVPGAMMSMVVMTLLNDITRERKSYVASSILEDLDSAILGMMPDLRRSDAIDVALLVIDLDSRRMDISAANRKVVVARGGEMRSIEGDKRHIGYFGDVNMQQSKFRDTYIDYESGDSVYLFTDGVETIFDPLNGSPYDQFVATLGSYNDLPINNRASHIIKSLLDNARMRSQRDDYTIVGIEL